MLSARCKFFFGQLFNVKPDSKLEKSAFANLWLAALRLTAGILVLGSSIAAAQNTPEPSADNGLWHTEGLPESAVFRFGSTDRNPAAIGIYALKFSQDGTLIAARDRRQRLRVLDLDKQEVLALLPTQSSLDFLISPDHKSVVVGNRKSVQIWDVSSGEIEREIKTEGYKLAISRQPDNQVELITVGKGSTRRYEWPLPSKPKVTKSKLVGGTILPAGVSDDGKLAVFHNGAVSEVLDTVEGISIVPSPKTVPKRAIISPNSHLMADLNYGDSKLKIFDLRNAEKYVYVLQDKRRVVTATFSNDSRFLYTSNYDNSIVIWDMVTMKAVDRVAGHGARIYTLAANPTRLLCLASGASGSKDRSLLYWNFRDRLFPDLELANDLSLDQAWEAIGSDDAAISLHATNQIRIAIDEDPNVARWLIKRLGIGQAFNEKLAAKLVKDLDDRSFDVREKATTMLKAMIESVRPMLEKRFLKSSQEAKWRINRILRIDASRPEIMTPAGRRNHRIVLALELSGNPAAVETLRQLSQNSSNPSLANQANAAMERISDSVRR